MGKTKHNKKTYTKFIIIAILIVFLISSGLLFLKMWERGRGRFPESNDIENSTVMYNGTEYTLNESIETFLVIGLDKFEGASVSDSYNNDQQADFLMLFVFDNDAQKCTAIHVNRDTMAQVNILGVAGNKIDTVTKQIALAHTYGNGKDVSCRNTADAVSMLLMNMKVDHYISLTMDSVALLNDLVGGVDVTVLDDFSGIDDTLVQGQTVTLYGEHALHYVRSRYGLEDSSNRSRMERQQQYINALFDKFSQCMERDDDFVVDASLKMADYIISDRSITQLQAIANKFNQFDFVGISNIAGESKLGEQFMEFYPDEDSIKETVMELFYKPKN